MIKMQKSSHKLFGVLVEKSSSSSPARTKVGITITPCLGRSIEISEDQVTGIEKEINVAKLQIDSVKCHPMNAKFGRPRCPQHKQKTCFNCGGNYGTIHIKITNLAQPKDRDADRATR